MAKEEKSNNLVPGSEKEQPKDKTGLDEKDEGGEKELLAGKFKSPDELVKAYQDLEAEHTRKSQEASGFKDRLAKLEGVVEERQRQAQKPPEITPEEYQKMTDDFKKDFDDPLRALANFNRPWVQQVGVLRDELQALKGDYTALKKGERKRELMGLASDARRDDPEGFDESKDAIEKELRENEAWAKFENPYRAVLYHLKGKSVRKLAKAADTERESFVEGSSGVPPKEDKKKGYVQKIVKARTNSRL